MLWHLTTRALRLHSAARHLGCTAPTALAQTCRAPMHLHASFHGGACVGYKSGLHIRDKCCWSRCAPSISHVCPTAGLCAPACWLCRAVGCSAVLVVHRCVLQWGRGVQLWLPSRHCVAQVQPSYHPCRALLCTCVTCWCCCHSKHRQFLFIRPAVSVPDASAGSCLHALCGQPCPCEAAESCVCSGTMLQTWPIEPGTRLCGASMRQ